MTDVTVKTIDDFENFSDRFYLAGKGLGVTAWGMNLLRMPANWQEYPDHDHLKDGQEEVYVALEGTATLHADGQQFELKPGVLVRVGPAQKRKIVPGPDGFTMLALGGTPGQAFEPRWKK